MAFFQQAQAIDWAQPAIGCVEEVIPQAPQVPCPDLTTVKEPVKDLPATLTPEEVAIWTGERKRALLVCRAREILRREGLRPGSMDAIQVEVAWMRDQGTRNTPEKIAAIYDASDETGVPPQVLLGALAQESMMAELGITEDGANFSCGIGQMNVLEWCGWAESLPDPNAAAIDWPRAEIARMRKSRPGFHACRTPFLKTELVRPYHQIARSRLGGRPGYRLEAGDFENIPLSAVQGSFPDGSKEEQELRHAIVKSFTRHCSGFRVGIEAKAHELRALFRGLPEGLRDIQQYRQGERFGRACLRETRATAYPMHVGWLIADALYNAGGRAFTAIAYFRGLDSKKIQRPETWEKVTPQDLVDALYGAGKYNPKTDRVEFEDLGGNPDSMTWFKACIVQRHVARVVQHTTLPGFELVQSREDKWGCKKGNPPPERKTSSGRLERGNEQ